MSVSATRRDEVADALREAILDGRLGPGDRLVEDRVMEWLGATRSGARKAFRRLEHEGLLISYPYRGVEVLGVSPEEVHGVLIPIRLMLERFAFSKALELMTPADLEAGVSAFWSQRVRIDLSMVRRTDEFVGQRQADIIGTAAVAVTW